MCNANFIDAYVPREETTITASESALKDSFSPIKWLFVLIFFVFLIIIVALLACLWWRMKPKKSDVEMGPHPVAQSPDFSLDKLRMLSIIGTYIVFLMVNK